MFASGRRRGSWGGAVRLLGILVFAVIPTLQITAAAAENAGRNRPHLSPPSRPHPALPASLSDSAFWALSSGLSEAGGSFQSDNFTSNEMGISRIAGELLASGRTGGVYVGVGPEQNFTYMAALRPQMAFVIDIRRQAIIQQLMYKALFEMSRDRADFISLLFSKPRPAEVDTTASIQDIWGSFWGVRSDSALFARNLAAIRERLVKRHGFALTAEDERSLEYVYRAFYWIGPRIGYGGYAESDESPGTGVNFATLTMSVDAAGVPRSFLATEAAFRAVQQLQARNLVVPVVGDFSGDKALRGIAQYLTAHHAPITAFYVSNVEQHLFQADNAKPFYANVATMPVDSASIFIRPALYYEPSPAALCPMVPFMAAYAAGRMESYGAALRCAQ